MRRRRSIVLVVAFAAVAVVLSAGSRGSAQEPVTVFAAASLTDAVERIAELYEAETGAAVRLSFAASSTLARQITAGAPAEIYLSANERWMDHVEDAGLIEPETRVSALGNRLVLIAPADSALDRVTVDAGLDLAALVDDGARIAMADPAHTPVGLYAREALRTLGLWGDAAPRLARTAEVRAAVALVASGEAPLGVVYATDAVVTPAVKVVGRIPPETHTPISYPFAILEGAATPAVEAFFAYLRGPEARAVFEDAGFTVR
ncbi:MAG: molybdate ABC transporter substrate-binding protein [Alphaproteobacteria bacterium]|jgi:molybdate transport system substrate-binding protein|nr:molybdate ABC transporter substrate-binding protein [Alphaproteobacteria bacterium]